MTASSDGTARLWWVDGRVDPVVLEGHQEIVLSASFNAAGDRVVTAFSDGTARIWHLSGVALQKVIRAATTVCLDTDFREKSLGESPDKARKKHEACEREQEQMP